jgi:putative phosphoribosyl transferase
MSGVAARLGAPADVAVSTGGAELAGLLGVPPHARGLVVFAHGSGSGRLSPRNRAVANALEHAGLATLLLDLLTPEEEAEDARTRRLRIDVRLLGERVVGAIDWVDADAFVGDLPASLASLPVGCLGASTGAAAALIAAAERPERVRAVVSRGGRPDLAADALPRVAAPTVLIVGGRDEEVIKVNRMAQQLLAGPSRLEIVPGAGHLFEEPGALERVAELTIDCFLEHLARAG